MTSPWGNPPQIPPRPCVFPLATEPLTPEDLGTGDDIVSQAIYALSRFGDDHTAREARILLSSWARIGELSPEQIGEVLDYYQPVGAVALPPHCPGLLPLVDSALRGAA